MDSDDSTAITVLLNGTSFVSTRSQLELFEYFKTLFSERWNRKDGDEEENGSETKMMDVDSDDSVDKKISLNITGVDAKHFEIVMKFQDAIDNDTRVTKKYYFQEIAGAFRASSFLAATQVEDKLQSHIELGQISASAKELQSAFQQTELPKLALAAAAQLKQLYDVNFVLTFSCNCIITSSDYINAIACRAALGLSEETIAILKQMMTGCSLPHYSVSAKWTYQLQTPIWQWTVPTSDGTRMEKRISCT